MSKQFVQAKHIEKGIAKYQGKKEDHLQSMIAQVGWNYIAYRFMDNRILLVARNRSHGVLYATEAALLREIELHPYVAPTEIRNFKLLILQRDIQKGIIAFQGVLDLTVQRHLDNAQWKYAAYRLNDNRLLLVYKDGTFGVLYKNQQVLFREMDIHFKEPKYGRMNFKQQFG